MNLDKLKADLVRDEGLRLMPYKDSVGKLTIGVGHNLTDRPISERAAQVILEDDIKVATTELDANCPWWRAMKEPAQRALANMTFNLGISRLLRFEKMLAALQARDYERAAREAMDSRWARQVGARARRIVDLYMEG